MPNPDDNNSPVQNKQKEGKEFVQEHDAPKKEGVNLEQNYKSKDTKPISINLESGTESRAVGNNTAKKTTTSPLTWKEAKEQEQAKLANKGSGSLSNDLTLKKKNSSTNNSSGGLSEDPKLTNTTTSNPNDLSSGSLGTAPKDYVSKVPEGSMPTVKSTPSSESEDAPKETTGNDTPKQEAASTEQPSGSGDPKSKEAEEKKEAPKVVVPEELKGIFSLIAGDSKKEDKVPTESADEEGAKKVEEAKQDIAAQNKLESNPTQDTNGASESSTSTSQTTTTTDEETTAAKDKKKDPNAEALAAFDVAETEEEVAEDTVLNEMKNEAKNRGLMVGRSIGYGAKIVPVGEKFSITKFSESGDLAEEEAAKEQYNKANDQIAKNMEEFGTEEVPENFKEKKPQKKGYYDAYIQGYNEGHREGTALKAEAAAAERTAQMKKEQGTDEYKVGASLGMLCGILTAKGETEVDTTFSMKKDGKPITVPVKTTVAELDSAAFEKKQTPGGELTGSAYEKAFLLHYNMGYREGQNQRTQPPPMDEDYKLGYEQGYKLGTQKANGAKGDEDLLVLEATYDAKDEQTLKKDELQQYRGFYAGYNKAHRQAQEATKNKAQKEREEKNKNPNFIAGYSTGNLKGFLTAMIEPSGIDLLTALDNPTKMEEAGVPDYFPIPPELRDSIKATIRFGEVAESDTEKDPTKALLGKPLFKEGLLFGYNRGYGQGQKSRVAFKRDKHKMHPDYQRALLVLMPDPSAEYKGPVGDGTFEIGFTIGQILANAQFELNQLTGKEGRSEKEEKRFADLTKAVAGLNGVIGKENSYYQSGVDEFFNWWMGVLAKKAQEDKVKYGYSGEEGSPKREGFEWGMKVGAKVIEGKEKLKEINRKGRDIKDRRKGLNNAIQKSEDQAKATSKTKGGEDYYIGYRNGYNHAFRVAKEAKKSDQGNLDTDDLLVDAGGKGSRYIGQIYDEVITKVDLKIDLSREEFSKAVEAEVKKESEGKTKKAFQDGLSRGYNSGYSATVFDIKTGKITTNNIKSDEEHLRTQYDAYKSQHKGNFALRVFYFFLVGYQYHKKSDLSNRYGLPKGIADAESFNKGYEVAVAESKGGKLVDKSGEASSKDAYKAGYNAAKYQARYNAFKNKMVRSAVANETSAEKIENSSEKEDGTSGVGTHKGDNGAVAEGGNVKGVTTKTDVESEPAPKREVDDSLTSGFAALAKAEHIDSDNAKEEKSKFYLIGYEEATSLWTKIIYMRKGVHLEGANIPKEVPIKLLEEGASLEELESISLTTDDKEMATKYYYNQDEFIEKIANYYIEENFSWELFKSGLSLDFSALWNAWNDYSKEREKARQKYIDGYKAKIAFIESSYKEKFINNWLYDFAYYLGLTEVAPETKIALPSAPYAQMSGDEIDYDSSYYKEGYLEGLKAGNLIKTGVIKPSDADLAGVSGDDYKRGFEEGKEEGAKEGLVGAQNPLKEPPVRKDIVEALNTQYKEENNGINDAMNYDYSEGYLEAYFSTYWETRNYEYGRILGYKRGEKGGDAMFNSKPEEGVRIDDKDAFFRGFDEGRDLAASGLPMEALDGKAEKDSGSYGEDYAQMLKENTANELGETQGEKTEGHGLGESGNSALAVLKDLLLGGSQDFYLDNILLLKMFHALETKVDDVQFFIKQDLEDIELNRTLANLSSESSFKKELEELANLEEELKNEGLSEGEQASLEMSILIKKADIADAKARSQQVQHDWEAAEAAAKKKINDIRLLMKERLAFDTPLKSNDDILKYIKINLESSKGNNEDIYEDIDIFNNLSLKGAFNYEESRSVAVSILGNADLHLDHHAENVHIENADVLMSENGFEFKARGLSYVKDDKELTFMGGSIIVPSIEGGEHVAKQYKYNFDDFNVHLNQGIKSQIDAQKYKLEGGPV